MMNYIRDFGGLSGIHFARNRGEIAWPPLKRVAKKVKREGCAETAAAGGANWAWWVLVLAPILVIVFVFDVVIDVLGYFLEWECKNPEEHLNLKIYFTSGFYIQFIIWISFQMLEYQVERVVEDSTSGFG
jgi:hypothetical protein